MLSHGEVPEEPWETIYPAVRHTVREDHYRHFEKSADLVADRLGLDLLVRNALGFCDPLPTRSEETFQKWITLWAQHIVRERLTAAQALTDAIDKMAQSITDHAQPRPLDQEIPPGAQSNSAGGAA